MWPRIMLAALCVACAAPLPPQPTPPTPLHSGAKLVPITPNGSASSTNRSALLHAYAIATPLPSAPPRAASRADERPMSAAELFAEARAQSSRLMDGGLVLFAEWFLVLLLVAPGTFPVITCALLSCTGFVQRRLRISSLVQPPLPLHAHTDAAGGRDSAGARALGDVVDGLPPRSGARPRSSSVKGEADDRQRERALLDGG